MSSHSTHVVLPADLLLQFLEENHSGWSLQEHPELSEGAAAWVESMRQEDERIDTESSTQ